MNRRIVLTIMVVLLAAALAGLFLYITRDVQPKAALPNPNGYDDFASAAQLLVMGTPTF